MCRGEAHGLATDVWSLGMTVLWMFGECDAGLDGAIVIVIISIFFCSPYFNLSQTISF
jgi:hypothetical protein